MGGRGSSSSPRVMTEEEYLNSKGYAFMGYSEAGMHIGSQHVSERQKRQQINLVQERAREYDNKRAELRQEYNRLVEQGKIRKPTQYEQALKISKGNPERADVQAAKRLVEKYRQRMKNTRSLFWFPFLRAFSQ